MFPSDAELASQALSGSQPACQALVARYAAAAVNLVARMVRDRALAEDLAQEAFARAFARLSTYDPQRTFASWFFQIARNVTIDHLRRKRVETLSLDQLEEAGHQAGVSSPDDSPEAHAARAGLARALEDGLARLRPEYRDAIVLRYQEGLGHDEMSEVLGVPVGTVKTYLHRGRKELAVILSARGWGPAETFHGRGT